MLRLSSNRRQRLFESRVSDKPKSSFKLPSSDLFLTLVIVISYFLTRIILIMELPPINAQKTITVLINRHSID